jgi:uncharacterized membrane protein YedE/YeeE
MTTVTEPLAGGPPDRPEMQRPPIQRPVLMAALVVAVALFLHLADQGTTRGLLLLVGMGLGVGLFHAAFGFTAAYRRAWEEREMSGIAAQVAMLALATLLFAPILAEGEILGHRAGGAVAPVDTSLLVGAFIFGIGMQLGGGCASGTLFTAGGGNVRMAIVFVFFCLGGFWATFDMAFWRSLPSWGAVSFGRELGYGAAAALQIAVLGAILFAVSRVRGAHFGRPLWRAELGWGSLPRGPWPLLWGALVLALGNVAILALAGHPWGVTWGFTVWAAKAAAALGWDPATSAYWSVGWRKAAVDASFLGGTTSITNIGIVLGAAIAASLAGKVRPNPRIPLRPLAAAVIGGLMLGYGARLAYGCNIGAFFSGIASSSLHGWVWIVPALVGNIVALPLRRWFRLG